MDEYPECPWFDVRFGEACMVAEWLDDSQSVCFRTFDGTAFVLTDCENGADAMWAAIRKVAISHGNFSLGAVE